jgi:hypothetical protein
MADKKASSKSKKTKGSRAKKAERTERRFLPERSNTTMLTMAGTIGGGLGVGAGIYGQWVADPRVGVAPWLVAGGAAVLAAVLLWGDLEGTSLRVGDAGIAWEREGKVTRRVAWCDMREVGIRDGAVRIEAEGETLTFSITTHPVAAAWAAKEAEARIPKRWKADKAAVEALPKTSPEDGERLDVEPLQVTGRACRASKRAITFERDARFCPRCGEVYHKEALPDRCLTCDADLEDAQEQQDEA